MPISTTGGLSWMTNLKSGNAFASSILVDPIPPPTSTTTDFGISSCHGKPAQRDHQLLTDWHAKAIPLITLPGPSHPLVPVIAFPNLFNLNAFPSRSSHSKYLKGVSNATLNGAYISSPRRTPRGSRGFFMVCVVTDAGRGGTGGGGAGGGREIALLRLPCPRA